MGWQNTKSIIYLDMDGTFVDLYGYPNWIEFLKRNSVYPYEVAKPMCNMSELIQLLVALQTRGYEIGIITWGSKNASKFYNERINKEKRAWLKRYGLWEIVRRNYNYLEYGVDKSKVFGKYDFAPTTLIDDNEEVRENFEKVNTERSKKNKKKNKLSHTYDPTKYGVLSCLYEILETIMKEEEN